MQNECDRMEMTRTHRWCVMPLALAIGVITFIVYAWTAQRGISWQDSGVFQARILTGQEMDLGGGLAVVHPWYLTAAKAFCFGFSGDAKIWAVNAFSGLGLAVAVTMLFGVIRQLTGNSLAALVAAVTLGLAHMAWWLATIAEVYTWSLAFLMTELLCLIQVVKKGDYKWWMMLAFVNGMHASLHNVAFLNLPVYGIVWGWQAIKRTRRWWDWIGGAAVWCVGASLLLAMVWSDWRAHGDLIATLKSLLFGSVWQNIVLGVGKPSFRLILANLSLAMVSMLSPCWLFAGTGWRWNDAGSRAWCWVLLGMTVTHGFFWVRYFVPDQATFVLPTLGLCAVWVGMGAARYGRRVLLAALACGIVCQVVSPLVLVEIAKAHVARARTLPFRDEAKYWLIPWKHNENSACQFVKEVDRQLANGDMLIADLTAVTAIMAGRTAGIIKGDWHVGNWQSRFLKQNSDAETLDNARMVLERGNRVFVVSPVKRYVPDNVLKTFDFEQDGVLWRVKK